jgi:hypothetical protein
MAVAELRQLLGPEVTDAEAAAVFEGLLRTAAVEMTSGPFDATRQIGDYPHASRLVRYQAAQGVVTSATHRPVRLEDTLVRHLLPLLDGNHSVSQVRSLLQGRLRPDRQVSEAQWETIVQEHISRLAELALLSTAEGDSRGASAPLTAGPP